HDAKAEPAGPPDIQSCRPPGKHRPTLASAADAGPANLPQLCHNLAKELVEYAAAKREMSVMLWGLLAVIVLIAVVLAWAFLLEWNAHRRAVKRGRTLTAKYGIPW